VTVASANKSMPDRTNRLVGAAKDGLLALSVGVGLRVLADLIETEVDEVVGSRGRHDPQRSAVRHGHEAGEVTPDGRRVGVSRPRVRSANGRARRRCRHMRISRIVIR
jgi:putative transposase